MYNGGQRNKGDGMKETYTAVVKQSGPWWIGWIEEIPGVNCQERKWKALFETLRVTLREAVEFNRGEDFEAGPNETYEEIPEARRSDGRSTNGTLLPGKR